MATRNRRYRGHPRDWRGRPERDLRPEDNGYIAQRGFGNPSAGYERDIYEDRYAVGPERDFGDSAGYGTGGSERDWRDVVGEDRMAGETAFGIDYGRARDRDYYSSSYEYDRDVFGRGSRDYGEERSLFERAGDEIRSWFGDEEADRRRDMDVRHLTYRGRGPKGYQRPDARILEDVNDHLTDDPYIDATDIEVSATEGEVTLSGTVASRFEKRHAEDLADSVSGIKHVQNNLRVRPYAETGGSSSA
ncbi:BON domain-containing protein [Microvirga terricola]|uniref:BON domain-containing protein n=1 Tax=Microvirga terricola TaxID=2719797 RepID=A0ABX0VAB9_9HYPH|nr:BON domain-containing protein [Microvirga terricola]NIX76286.1 BON domain-containing protein [Microvirga terricola]